MAVTGSIGSRELDDGRSCAHWQKPKGFGNRTAVDGTEQAFIGVLGFSLTDMGINTPKPPG